MFYNSLLQECYCGHLRTSMVWLGLTWCGWSSHEECQRVVKLSKSTFACIASLQTSSSKPLCSLSTDTTGYRLSAELCLLCTAAQALESCQQDEKSCEEDHLHQPRGSSRPLLIRQLFLSSRIIDRSLLRSTANSCIMNTYRGIV